MIDEKILIDILDSKERRAKKQAELIDKYKNTLISFTLNIPGRVKDNKTYRAIHREGMEIILKNLQNRAIKILYKREEEHNTGREGYILVEKDSEVIKKIAIHIEKTHPLGRIFDIDVFNSKNQQINRKDLEEASRKCLLCENDARLCMRMGKHSYESLIESINNSWIKYINKKQEKGKNRMGNNRKIGILDSGVGGLTVAKEVGNLLPNESIIYLGDNANVPYGNKTKEEIYRLTKKMVDFLIEKNVKMIAIACNTISSILDEYFLDLEIPIISIIRPVVKHIDQEKLENIGVIATEFTINSGIYEKYLWELDENLSIVTEGSPYLAAMIDRGDYKEEEMMKEVSDHMDSMLAKGKVENVILGCTHYPIVMDSFQKKSPHINFINPAYEQAMYMKKLMEENSTEADREQSTFEVYTTGNKETYFNMLASMSAKRPDAVYEIEKF